MARPQGLINWQANQLPCRRSVPVLARPRPKKLHIDMWHSVRSTGYLQANLYCQNLHIQCRRTDDRRTAGRLHLYNTCNDDSLCRASHLKLKLLMSCLLSMTTPMLLQYLHTRSRACQSGTPKCPQQQVRLRAQKFKRPAA